MDGLTRSTGKEPSKLELYLLIPTGLIQADGCLSGLNPGVNAAVSADPLPAILLPPQQSDHSLYLSFQKVFALHVGVSVRVIWNGLLPVS
jgi:hypothetical protein